MKVIIIQINIRAVNKHFSKTFKLKNNFKLIKNNFSFMPSLTTRTEEIIFHKFCC